MVVHRAKLVLWKMISRRRMIEGDESILISRSTALQALEVVAGRMGTD